MKSRFSFIMFTLFVLAMPSAHATLIQYDINVSADNWYDSGNPYGMAFSPTLFGTLTIDDAFNSIDALVSFSFETGSKLWTESDLNASIFPLALYFNGAGELDDFQLGFGETSANSLIIASFNTVNVVDGGQNNACNGCVSFQLSQSQTTLVSEAPVVAIFITGLMALTLRRRKNQDHFMEGFNLG